MPCAVRRPRWYLKLRRWWWLNWEILAFQIGGGLLLAIGWGAFLFFLLALGD